MELVVIIMKSSFVHGSDEEIFRYKVWFLPVVKIWLQEKRI